MVEQPAQVRVQVHVTGIVQGVGFRPFVWREATGRSLSGWVGNDSSGVVLQVEGSPASVASLLDALTRPPPLARVEQVRSAPIAVVGSCGFAIHDSATHGSRRALVSPDTATCRDCERELLDPADRRFAHPFINCTGCGPRYTIVHAVPYDRSRTTMSDFPLCEDCATEYADPGDRRFHAEPVCCPRCGPRLTLTDRSGTVLPGDPVAGAAGLLRAGALVAVKGIGGYHLAADARDEQAVRTLRQRKHREDRAFALMVLDLAAAQELCVTGPVEQELLTSAARPIVLLARRADDGVAAAVAPGSPTLGVMLAYTALHLRLLRAFDGPLVMTSGNVADEPIAFDDTDAVVRLGGIADAFLSHDRAIRTRVDDSVCAVVRDRVVPVRRSRGYVPAPLRLAESSPEPVLACGSAMKSTFCLLRDRYAFVSQHIGDLDDYATLLSYVDGITHLSTLLDTHPHVVAHDLHPDYPSTRYAVELPDVELVGVQHHHAHVASCLADNGVSGPVIGVAFDGTGLGTDGTSWGGEFLVADLEGFTRVAHLADVAQPGGDAAARQPWRMAAAHLDAAYDGALPTGLAVAERQRDRWDQVLSVVRAGVGSPLTSSAGRLFDAVSSLLGVRDAVTYEGQAAIELEHLVDRSETGTYPVPVSDEPVPRVLVAHLVRAVVEDLLRGTPRPVIAARFHTALTDTVVTVCRRLREEHRLSEVALSGGVFQNGVLLEGCLEGLEEAGFTVLTHRQVPPNDGGLSLGQAAVAAALLRRR